MLSRLISRRRWSLWSATSRLTTCFSDTPRICSSVTVASALHPRISVQRRAGNTGPRVTVIRLLLSGF
jgi:hypothetical protein